MAAHGYGGRPPGSEVFRIEDMLMNLIREMLTGTQENDSAQVCSEALSVLNRNSSNISHILYIAGIFPASNVRRNIWKPYARCRLESWVTLACTANGFVSNHRALLSHPREVLRE